MVNVSRLIDLTNKTFGRLKVIKRVENYESPKGHKEPQYLCECECGNQVVVLRGNLKKGTTKSCGCLQGECRSINGRNNKKKNIFDLVSNDYGVGYTTKGEEFYFDLEDYDKIKDYCWLIDQKGYVVSRENNKEIQMHRIIMNCKSGMIVDHKHGKKTRNDNRKYNLRIGTYSNNMYNRKTGKNSTSGIVGVNWSKNENKWLARIAYDHKRINLGYFDSFDDAIKARKEAEEKYFGEWSYDNSNKNKINKNNEGEE